MCRTQCVLALLALCVGLAHSFSWDVVLAKDKKLYFFNDGKITFSDFPLPTYYYITWVGYDPVHNRVLFSTYQNERVFLTTFNLGTEIPQNYIKVFPDSSIKTYAYDPVSEVLFASSDNSIYSFSLKSGDSNQVNGTVVVDLKKDNTWFRELAVDTCGKYLYWVSDSYKIERARFDGTDREVIVESNNEYRQCLTIEGLRLYWVDNPQSSDYEYTVQSADLNGNNRKTLYSENDYLVPNTLTVSKDFIYWANTNERFFWKLPKNPQGTDEEAEHVSMNWHIQKMAANYDTKQLTKTIRECEAVKSNSESLTTSSDGSLLCVHGTKVSGKNLCECTLGYTGARCDVSVCQNYCVRGQCSVSAEGQPKCSCNAGYSGDRCEDHPCSNYCLNNGACSVKENNEPVCQCTEAYEGDRCDVPVFLIKCVQTVSLLKDLIKTDLASVTLGKQVSTCAATVV